MMISHERERFLILRHGESSLRILLPGTGIVRIAEDLAPDHPILRQLAPASIEIVVEQRVAIRERNGAIEWSKDGTHFLPGAPDQWVDVEWGTHLRVGQVAMMLVEAGERAADGVRLLDTASFRWFLEHRKKTHPDAIDVVASLKWTPPLEATKIKECLLGVQRGGDVVGCATAGEVDWLIVDVAIGEAVARIRELAQKGPSSNSQLAFGVCLLNEGTIESVLSRARERRALGRQDVQGKRPFIKEAPAMRSVLESMTRAATTQTPVLVTGETGTGKDLVAEWIHAHSSRAFGPFVRLSCAVSADALNPDQIPGFLARARGGTMVVDDVASLGTRAQLGLLYLLDEAEAIAKDVRMVLTSDASLEERVRKGEFRKDILFRLHANEIQLPPLRDRREDIVLLAENFANGGLDPSDPNALIVRFQDGACKSLEAHAWPGNVRELKNRVERACERVRGDAHRSDSARGSPVWVLATHLGLEEAEWATSMERGVPTSVSGEARAQGDSQSEPSEGSTTLKDELLALEKRRILEALRRYPTQKDAAESLGMPMRTFVNRLDALGIPRARSGGRTRDDEEGKDADD